MAKRSKAVEASLDFAFFHVLWQFYFSNRGSIRSHYKELTRKFLDFNNPEKSPKAFLRQPQFEALEIYVFLKEFLSNAKLEDVFRDWFEKKGRFAGRAEGGIVGDHKQGTIFDVITKEQYEPAFAAMLKNARRYPNYIFALTMGTGKTILMGVCIFYEFLLGNKFEQDKRYCHNALVFAPDKTVLQSLRELETFDMRLVVPAEYVSFLSAHVRFHYLDEAGMALSTLDKSRFNIIVSNTQKIILKRQHKQKSSAEQLFGEGRPLYEANSAYEEASDLYNFDLPEDVAELTTNQRFEKIARLEQLGIYIDEAHHAFGKALARDMGLGTVADDTSLRTTVDALAARLEAAGTHVVACFNYTGTPYVGREVLPEVVYAYGLKQAIENQYLKKVELHSYANTKTQEFVQIVIDNFLEQTKDLSPEGLRPKIAFFASTIDELTKELRPALEAALARNGRPATQILVNVGDDQLTSNDDIREFNRLDTIGSEKQFILLVNKGKEGWNCRSLFGVALYRQPRSKIFVLQATMRCLRAIGTAQHTGHVYLSEDNLQILNEELQQNFRISAEEFQQTNKNKERVQVRIVRPPIKIKLKRVRTAFSLRTKAFVPGVELGLKRADAHAWAELTKPYQILHLTQKGLTPKHASQSIVTQEENLTHVREKRFYSQLTLVAEIARYLHRSPLEIEAILDLTNEGTNSVVAAVNEYNELLYDVVIPRLFSVLYELEPKEQTEEHEIELVREPPAGRDFYEVTADKDKIVRMSDPLVGSKKQRSFHLDTYCFDSKPEQALFWYLLEEKKIDKIFFTGMLTHGQSDFFIQYIDPESHTVRSYYPDFIAQQNDGTYVIIEVKGDNMVDDRVVKAKQDYAAQMALASGMKYRMIKGTDAQSGAYQDLLQ